MQTEAKRACPSCGAENPVGGEFCWQCYARFQPPAPAAGPGRPDLSPAFGVSTAPAVPAPQRRRPSSVVRLGVGLVAAAVGYLGVQAVFGSSHASLPDSVAGLPRITSPAVTQLTDQVQAQGDDWNLDVQVGGYGTGLSPDIVVILVDGSASETTDQLFESFTGGVAQAGARVDQTRQISGERDGTEYRCVPVESSGLRGAACMWRDDDNVGIVLDLLHGIDDVEPVLWETHDAALD